MAVEQGDLPRGNCAAYAKGEDRDHDPHTHQLPTGSRRPSTLPFWCQGRPANERAKSLALVLGAALHNSGVMAVIGGDNDHVEVRLTLDAASDLVCLLAKDEHDPALATPSVVRSDDGREVVSVPLREVYEDRTPSDPEVAAEG